MPVPSTIADLSTTAASNSPAGSESPNTVDDYLRAHAAIIKTQDATDVKLTGDQTIAGVKTFSSPIVGSATNVTGIVAPANGGTGQNTLALAGAALGVVGVGQTWQNVTGSRAFNTNYSNTAGRPIVVVANTGATAFYAIEVLVDGVSLYTSIGNYTVSDPRGFVYFMVPTGASYRINSGASLSAWFELR